MNHSFYYFVLAGLLLFSLGSQFTATPHPCLDGPEEILIHQDPTDPSGDPRSPSFNPFFAYEDGSSVTLGSVSSYGDVAVTLVSTAGDNYQTVFDTEDVQIVIPISGATGHYTLTLVTERGLVFEGEFDL